MLLVMLEDMWQNIMKLGVFQPGPLSPAITNWVSTQFGHRLPTGNGESAAFDSVARSADYSISCGHPMAEPGI